MQVHFASDMWMTRKDGSCRVKSDAIPTIFGENLATSITKQNTMTEAAETDVFENISNKMEEEMEINEDITEEEKNNVLGIHLIEQKLQIHMFYNVWSNWKCFGKKVNV